MEAHLSLWAPVAPLMSKLAAHIQALLNLPQRLILQWSDNSTFLRQLKKGHFRLLF